MLNAIAIYHKIEIDISLFSIFQRPKLNKEATWVTQYLTIHVRSFRSKKKKENYLAEQILQKDHRLLPSIKCDESNTNARTLLHACQRFQSLSIFPADATTCHNLATREDSRSKTPRGDPRQVSQLKLHDDSRGKWATYSTCSRRNNRAGDSSRYCFAETGVSREAWKADKKTGGGAEPPPATFARRTCLAAACYSRQLRGHGNKVMYMLFACFKMRRSAPYYRRLIELQPECSWLLLIIIVVN